MALHVRVKQICTDLGVSGEGSLMDLTSRQERQREDEPDRSSPECEPILEGHGIRAMYTGRWSDM